jgi:hypothetical protein
MKKMLILTSLISALIPLQASASGSQETVRVWQIDTSGRPPFKRSLVEMPVADAARMEPVVTERVWTTDFSGRPPFKRGYRELPVVDAASLDVEASAANARPTPFFKKRHR